MKLFTPGKIVTAILCSAAVAILLHSLLTFTPNKPVLMVNFDQVGDKPTPTDQPLRVAVAAMTSPETTRRLYQDLLLHIGDQLQRKVQFIQRPTYTEVDCLLRDNKVDLAFVCSGSYALGHDRFGLELLAIPIIDGKRTYHSDIIVHRDCPHDSLEDLRHSRFAFTSKASNTGYLAPSYLLAGLNQTPETFFSDIVFSHGHDNSIRAVANGLVDAAAVDSLILEHMIHDEDPDALNVRVIERSAEFGIPPVVVPHQLPAELKEQLQRTLLNAHNTPRGRDILRGLRIDHFTLGDDDNYDSIREMARVCNDS